MSTASLTPSADRAAPMTEFVYLYRDGGNYKSWGSVFLQGNMTLDEVRRVTEALEAEEFFIAEQISLPALYGPLFDASDGPIASDHAWHSFVGFRAVDPSENQNEPVWGTTSQIVEAFVGVESWDISLSPNFAMSD